jgi:hypothetical protein
MGVHLIIFNPHGGLLMSVLFTILVLAITTMAGQKTVVSRVIVPDTILVVKNDSTRVIKCDTTYSVKEINTKVIKFDTLKITKVIKDTALVVKMDTVKVPAKK